MATTYRIHPGIGVARLGNSPYSFYISPEKPAALPTECDAQGNPLVSPDGMTELPVRTFKDDQGRIRRQAARFQVWAYDDDSPEGRPLELGDPVEGGGNAGTLVDIQWRVYLANKKASWYTFEQANGEHGYAPDHPRRNAAVTEPEARQHLIIDPGPRTIDCTTHRTAHFGRDGGDDYATTFPPPLTPNSIDSLGDILTDDSGRLLVLGGHGNSGSYLVEDGSFAQPRIETYANNDGWFDDTSDGPVMARLVMYSGLVSGTRFIDVESPAWVIAAYPRYVPEIPDIVTMDDVAQNLFITELADRTDIYGAAGTFGDPQRVAQSDEKSLAMWRAARLRWNPDYKPWFWRDIWTILYRPDEYSYLNNILGMSNYPHNQSTRGSFDPSKLSVPPQIHWHAVHECEQRCMARNQSGQLFTETLEPAFLVMEKPAEKAMLAAGRRSREGMLTEDASGRIEAALSSFAAGSHREPPDEIDAYLAKWRTDGEAPEAAQAKEDLERAIVAIVAEVGAHLPVEQGAKLKALTLEHLRKYHSGKLLEDCRRECILSNTHDPYKALRQFLFDLLRGPGEENRFSVAGAPGSRVHNLPFMPLLAGDNPISNTLPSKFLRLTDYQYYVLRQWSLGLFFNEELERWMDAPNPWEPYAGWKNRTARDLDRGVLSNVLGGAFCPGGEVTWVVRNPSIWTAPYRIKADPAYYTFGQTAAQANANKGGLREFAYASYVAQDLGQDNDFVKGLQPGDLTKYMALPWQADFNECTTQLINVTYEEWNQIYPGSDNDQRLAREQRAWETLWWPAHRPLQTWEISGFTNGQPDYIWIDWSPGVPQTNNGDLKMVTEWWRLAFVRRNPWQTSDQPTTLPPDQKYIGVERTSRK
jgi:hypothetical protein